MNMKEFVEEVLLKDRSEEYVFVDKNGDRLKVGDNVIIDVPGRKIHKGVIRYIRYAYPKEFTIGATKNEMPIAMIDFEDNDIESQELSTKLLLKIHDDVRVLWYLDIENVRIATLIDKEGNIFTRPVK